MTGFAFILGMIILGSYVRSGLRSIAESKKAHSTHLKETEHERLGF